MSNKISLIDKYQSKVPYIDSDPSYYSVHSTILNGAISPSRIMELYSQGQPLPNNVGVSIDSNSFRDVSRCTDKLDALQRAKDYNRSLVDSYYRSVASLPLSSTDISSSVPAEQ